LMSPHGMAIGISPTGVHSTTIGAPALAVAPAIVVAPANVVASPALPLAPPASEPAVAAGIPAAVAPAPSWMPPLPAAEVPFSTESGWQPARTAPNPLTKKIRRTKRATDIVA
jgi:hypothetical protein